MKHIDSWADKHVVTANFKKVIDLLKQHLAEAINQRSKIPADIFDVMKFELEENIDSYESMIDLYRGGHLQQCLMVARSIFENAVTLQYILKDDADNRARNFILFTKVVFVEGLAKMKQFEPEKEQIAQYIKTVKKSVYKSGTNKFKWDGRSFREICVELGYDKIYDVWYSRLSKYVHPHYKSSRDLDEDGPYNDFLKDFFAKDLVIVILQILKDINEKYNLLEGGMKIPNYPVKGAVTIFSISSSMIDRRLNR